jgi:hypothetical protein
MLISGTNVVSWIAYPVLVYVVILERRTIIAGSVYCCNGGEYVGRRRTYTNQKNKLHILHRSTTREGPFTPRVYSIARDHIIHAK